MRSTFPWYRVREDYRGKDWDSLYNAFAVLTLPQEHNDQQTRNQWKDLDPYLKDHIMSFIPAAQPINEATEEMLYHTYGEYPVCQLREQLSEGGEPFYRKPCPPGEIMGIRQPRPSLWNGVCIVNRVPFLKVLLPLFLALPEDQRELRILDKYNRKLCIKGIKNKKIRSLLKPDIMRLQGRDQTLDTLITDWYENDEVYGEDSSTSSSERSRTSSSERSSTDSEQ